MTIIEMTKAIVDLIKEIDEKREKLRLAPNIDDFREYSYLIDELVYKVAYLEAEKGYLKEDFKRKEADRVLFYKQSGEKLTIKEIEARVLKDLEEDKNILLKLDKYISLGKAKIQGANYFWKAIDSSLYHLNQREKQEILN